MLIWKDVQITVKWREKSKILDSTREDTLGFGPQIGERERCMLVILYTFFLSYFLTKYIIYFCLRLLYPTTL